MYSRAFLCNMTENLQADGVQSRQTLFVRYCHKYLRKNSVRQPVLSSFLTKTTLSIFTKKLLTRGIKSIIM